MGAEFFVFIANNSNGFYNFKTQAFSNSFTRESIIKQKLGSNSFTSYIRFPSATSTYNVVVIPNPTTETTINSTVLNTQLSQINNTTLTFSLVTANGSTYKTSSNHAYAVQGFESSGNSQNTTSTGNSRFVLTSQDHSTDVLRPMSLRMIVQPGPISSSRNVYINYYTFGICHDNEHAVAFNGAGYFASGEDKTFNNYKFFPSSGNFDAGLIKVYGIA